MAIDTADKRRSVVAMPPIADGSLTTGGDWQQIAGLYRGIVLVEAQAVRSFVLVKNMTLLAASRARMNKTLSGSRMIRSDVT